MENRENRENMENRVNIEINKLSEELFEKTIISELKEKYDIESVISNRYGNDLEINNFYQTYYNEIEKLEQIGFNIWKLFSKLWKDEKQETILDILNLIIFLEKESLKIKKFILNIVARNKHPNLIEDKQYLLMLINKQKKEFDDTYKFININSSYENIVELYLENRKINYLEFDKEFQRLKNLQNIKKLEKLNVLN